MKKEILIFVIIGLLLTQTSSIFVMKVDATIANKKIIENKESEETAKITTNKESLPDLKIEGKATRDWSTLEYIMTFSIYNYGDGIVKAGEYITIKISFWFQGGEWHYTAAFCLDESLEPGEHWTCQDRLPMSDTYVGDAEIDPTDYGGVNPIFHGCEPVTLNPDPVHGLIKESNEDNNKCFIELSKSRNRAFLLFERLFDLPIFLKLSKL